MSRSNLKKSRWLHRASRPGKNTAQYIRTRAAPRITFAGALYLSIVCMIPALLQEVHAGSRSTSAVPGCSSWSASPSTPSSRSSLTSSRATMKASPVEGAADQGRVRGAPALTTEAVGRLEHAGSQVEARESASCVKAGLVAAAILDEICAAAQPGTSTWELDQIARRGIDRQHKVKSAFLEGYASPPCPAVPYTSINEVVVHSIPNKRVSPGRRRHHRHRLRDLRARVLRRHRAHRPRSATCPRRSGGSSRPPKRRSKQRSRSAGWAADLVTSAGPCRATRRRAAILGRDPASWGTGPAGEMPLRIPRSPTSGPPGRKDRAQERPCPLRSNPW